MYVLFFVRLCFMNCLHGAVDTYFEIHLFVLDNTLLCICVS